MPDQMKKLQLPREFPGALHYGPEEEEAVLRVIRARSPFRYYGLDPQREAENLEKEFAQYLGRKHAQALSSGSNALMAAMFALGIGPGQEVLVPGFMWVATISAVVRAGGIPVLVDIDDSFNMDPEDLEKKITPRSGLIVPVHMTGVPCDMTAIMDVARRKGIRVLEDCAQANGARWRGQLTGTFGDAAMFSFQVNKNVTAGEGGIFVTDDETLFQRASAAHDVGVPWVDGTPHQDSDCALWGIGSRLNEISAAVIRAQVQKLDTVVANMRGSKQRIKAALDDLPGKRWRRVDDSDGDSGPFLFTIFETSERAQSFAQEANARGLTCCQLSNYGLHVYYHIRALTERLSHSADGFPWTHPANVELVRDYKRGALPRADALFDLTVSIPVPSRLDEELEGQYIATYREAYQAAM
jgi:dTDP-4-amino-4,6-dideoxygalactose transaminase